MTYPKMKKCPKCGGEVDLWTYESGWSRVECTKCDHISSCEGTKLRAIRTHNERAKDQMAEVFTEEQKAKHRAQDALYQETMKTP